MMMSGEYWELAAHYEHAAEEASDWHARQQLQTLAQSYFVLARSMSLVERSAKVLDRIEQRHKE